jgi:pyruvate,water dikinase
MAGHVIWFDEAEAADTALVGGKAANLGLLSAAGFAVPPGFTITTLAYAEFVGASGASGEIEAVLAGVDYESLPSLESASLKIRELLLKELIPSGIRSEIESAYAKLGPKCCVAVRSSGTAEDLVGASFAGMHDTFLNVVGAEALADAVKECWASLWSARVTSYRHTQGFAHSDAQMAVVVQTMLEPAVAGVMFTGNPINCATDELVISASWGLGEAVVQDLVSPDEFTVKAGTLRIIERRLGTKEKRVVRDGRVDSGTIVEQVPDADRTRYSLTDSEVAELADLGRRVTDYYGGFPQDTEWALAEDKFYLLQARPIAAVDFAWDADVDAWQWLPDDEDTLWVRSCADEELPGVVSPFFYSLRGWTWTRCMHEVAKRFSVDELRSLRYAKFHKGEFYMSAEWQLTWEKETWPPPLRSETGEGLWVLPNSFGKELLDAPFSYADYLRRMVRLHLSAPESGVYGWLKMTDHYCYGVDDLWNIDHIPTPQNLSDRELQREFDKWHGFEDKYLYDVGVPWYLWVRDSMGLLRLIIEKWYDGPHPVNALFIGSIRRTKTTEENHTLFALAKQIHNSDCLRAAFEKNSGADFFDAIEHEGEGQEFLRQYREFVKVHGHRGSENRDISYPRRSEDPSLDYVALKTLLVAVEAGDDPEVQERELNERRETIYADVLANLQAKPLGILKAEAFKIVYRYVHQIVYLRDDERWSYERYIMGQKILGKELGRRLVERGVLEAEDDFYFLTKDELYALLERRSEPNLARAKVAARRRDCLRKQAGEYQPPMFLQHNREVADDSVEKGRLRGRGTSPGTVTGTARVVKRLSETDRVKKGEIVVCNHTDPGWAAIFPLISGIVTETGSLVSHAACLSREYGIPAVTQLPKAMQLIPDGATITLNGNTGEVVVEALAEEVAV